MNDLLTTKGQRPPTYHITKEHTGLAIDKKKTMTVNASYINRQAINIV